MSDPFLPEVENKLREYFRRNYPLPPAGEQSWQQVAPHISPSFEGGVSAEVFRGPTPSIPSVHTRRSSVVGVGSLFAVLFILIFVGVVFIYIPAHRITGALLTTPTANVQEYPLIEGFVRSVSLDSANDGWAVGTQMRFTIGGNIPAGQTSSEITEPLLFHLTEGSWKQIVVSSLPAQQSQLLGISMANPQNGWAVGGLSSRPQSVILHYNGSSWSLASQQFPFVLGDVQAISSTDAWASTFQDQTLDSQYHILHFHDDQWTVEQTPTFGTRSTLTGLSMVSANEGWASGYYAPQSAAPPFIGFILHYHNGRWQTEETFTNNTEFTGLSMVSAQEGWATGWHNIASNAELRSPALFHYVEGQWHEVDFLQSSQPQRGLILDQVTMITGNNGWMNGNLNGFTYLYHYDGSGWKMVQVLGRNMGIGHMAFFTSEEGWGVGSKTYSQIGNSPLSQADFYHYTNGVWTEVDPHE